MAETPKRSNDRVWVVVLVALAIRLIVVGFLYQDQLNPRRDHWPFGYETGRIARAIALGEGFANPLFQKTGPTAWMTPLYPYLAAGIFKLFGIYSATSAVILLSLNSLFSALTCVPVFFMARESFGLKVANWAAWVWAFFPYAIYLSADWIWETCLTTLLLSLLFMITLRLGRAERPAPWALWAGYGLLWGITALSNPAVLALLPFFVGWAGYRAHRARHSWMGQAAVAIFALAIVVAPWFLRNYQTFHQLIPFRDNFWLEVWIGNHGDASLRPGDTAHPSADSSDEEKYNRGELDYMADKHRQATRFIRSQPAWFAGMVLRRALFTWTGFWSMPPVGQWKERFDPEQPFDPLNIAFCTGLSVLAFVGLFQAMREHRAIVAPYALAIFLYPLVYYTTNVEVRYRHPIEPEIAVLATYAWTILRGKKGGLDTGNFGEHLERPSDSQFTPTVITSRMSLHSQRTFHKLAPCELLSNPTPRHR
jgi:hypothetical protein